MSSSPLPATDEQWQDWQWQMRNRIRTLADLRQFHPGLDFEEGVSRAMERFPMAITPYYASLIRHWDERDPIYRMAMPDAGELIDPFFLQDDPLEEDHDMAVPGLIHRYPDRALLVSTTTCAMYCRHCTRKRVAGHRESTLSHNRLKAAVAYLEAHPEIHDVIISGGDPLTMPTPALERILKELRSVRSIDIVRIGTRTPVTMPMRITDELVEMLRRYHPLWINTHFNHPTELTTAARAACAKLADAGIPLGNQSVLLCGVNDDPRIVEQLCRELTRNRVRPYYLFQCDLVRGVEHLRTPLSRGIEIMEYLRGRLSGLAIPTFIVDAPHGGGKVPVLPNYVVSTSPTHTVLRNFEGMLVSYPEPNLSAVAQLRTALPQAATVYDLSTGRASAIQPATTTRHARRAGRSSSNKRSAGVA
ncbi:MAG: KamA family radical SAM protein [Myxococcota bacterium]|jgi:lysine 2,3-aminomutase|nr:KamA family radical SAM protein [Myxococcota bacterium]